MNASDHDNRTRLALWPMSLLMLLVVVGAYSFSASAQDAEDDGEVTRGCVIDGEAIPTGLTQPECDALYSLWETTQGPDWTTNEGWGTGNPCDWHGVTCAQSAEATTIRSCAEGLRYDDTDDRCERPSDILITQAPESCGFGEVTPDRTACWLPPLSPRANCPALFAIDLFTQRCVSLPFSERLQVGPACVAGSITPDGNGCWAQPEIDAEGNTVCSAGLKLPTTAAQGFPPSAGNEICLLDTLPEVTLSDATLTCGAGVFDVENQQCVALPVNTTQICPAPFLVGPSGTICVDGAGAPAVLSCNPGTLRIISIGEYGFPSSYAGRAECILDFVPSLPAPVATAECGVDEELDPFEVVCWLPVSALVFADEASVVGLDLAANDLRGQLPEELDGLTALTQLNLSANSIVGDIPASLAALTELRLLNLSANGLAGTLPEDLGDMTQLAALDLSDNRLEGSLPASIGEATGLVTLDIAKNWMSGALPPEVVLLDDLTTIGLAGNDCFTTDAGTGFFLTAKGVAPESICRAEPTCAGQPITVNIGLGEAPTAGDDVIYGTSGDDLIAAGDGNDIICGRGGDDTIWGQDGNDVLIGGEGDDKLRGGSGDDALHGDAGSDDLSGGRDDDVVLGGDDNDAAVRGGTGDDIVSGGNGDDPIVSGNGGSDMVFGNAGNDRVTGGPRPDYVDGGSGIDEVKGNNGADTVIGRDGDDLLFGGLSPDLIRGGDGVDQCNGGNGDGDVAPLCESIINVP